MSNYDSYINKLSEYLDNKKFFGGLENPDKVLFFKSVECGDMNEVHLKINRENNQILDISYTYMGCGLNVACLEILCSESKGKSLNFLSKVDLNFFKDYLDFPDSKSYCVQLLVDALRKNGF